MVIFMNTRGRQTEMTDTQMLRSAIVGLVRCAALEDELLLASTSHCDGIGSAERWGQVPTVAHNTEFKRQQVIRLEAVLHRQVPPNFAEIDHRSEEAYRVYAAMSVGEVTEEGRRAANDLVDALMVLSDADLNDPTRHEWLRGRPLWLQIIVRAFWHPMGHVGDWYVDNDMPQRGITLRRHAVATAEYLHAPDPSRGMAWYSLACTYAALGTTDGAIEALVQAAALNSDLRARIATEPDLETVREDRRVAALIG
jgi:hypothetical protein